MMILIITIVDEVPLNPTNIPQTFLTLFHKLPIQFPSMAEHIGHPNSQIVRDNTNTKHR